MEWIHLITRAAEFNGLHIVITINGKTTLVKSGLLIALPNYLYYIPSVKSLQPNLFSVVGPHIGLNSVNADSDNGALL